MLKKLVSYTSTAHIFKNATSVLQESNDGYAGYMAMCIGLDGIPGKHMLITVSGDKRKWVLSGCKRVNHKISQKCLHNENNEKW